MFTGIIRETGRVREIRALAEGATLALDAPQTCAALRLGGSVAVDGVCLTVTKREPPGFWLQVVPETLRRTRLGELAVGDITNLELPLKMGDPLDGHLVQGHVDGVGTVRAVQAEGIGTWVELEAPEPLRAFLAEKGSVSVNGVSLTIAAARPLGFAIALIPTTLELTNLKDLKEGSHVNLEVDVLARYVLHARGESS